MAQAQFPVQADLFLPMGCGVQPGDQVRWLLRDALTGEVLASQDASNQVDLSRSSWNGTMWLPV